MTYTDLVNRGAALLDSHVPGWRHKVRLYILDSATHHILDQVFDYIGYVEAKRELGIEYGYQYGFNLNWYCEIDGYSTHEDAWRDAWVKAIRQTASERGRLDAHPATQSQAH